MAKLVPENHPALHQIAAEVPLEEIGSPKINKVIKDMKEALAKSPRGVAIAAPQIGVPLRIFVVQDTASGTKHEGKDIESMVAINPQIIKASKKKAEMEEGCLSIPNKYGKTIRSTNVTLRAYDGHGEEFPRGAGGLLAHIFQHETAHLDGILYTEHAHELWDTDDLYEPKEDNGEA